MGAQPFMTEATGKNPDHAFSIAIEEATYWYGHGGYTGTIAEKDTFIVIDLPEDYDAFRYADKLIEDDDKRISDKWGDAGCILIGKNKENPKLNDYLFFGWASS